MYLTYITKPELLYNFRDNTKSNMDMKYKWWRIDDLTVDDFIRYFEYCKKNNCTFEQVRAGGRKELFRFLNKQTKLL